MSEPGTTAPAVAVVFLCHNGQQVVLGKRGTNARDEQDRWDIGGGAVDFGESPEQAVHREVREEYGTTVLDCQFLGYRSVVRDTPKGQTHWLALDYLVRVDPELVCNAEPRKLDAVEWFSLNNLPHPMHSQWPVFFEQYRSTLPRALRSAPAPSPLRVQLERLKRSDAARRWAKNRETRLVRICGDGWYWRPNRAGYTDQQQEAGIYTLADAMDASFHCGPEKRIVYEFLPENAGEPTQAPKGPAALLLQPSAPSATR